MTVALAKNLAKWAAYDWKQQDVTLAEQHGLTRARIQQIRKILNQPDPINKQRKRKAWAKHVVV